MHPNGSWGATGIEAIPGVGEFEILFESGHLFLKYPDAPGRELPEESENKSLSVNNVYPSGYPPKTDDRSGEHIERKV